MSKTLARKARIDLNSRKLGLPLSRRQRLSMARQTALPPTLPPRLINREAAAAYVSVSPNTFDQMVTDRRMPRPKLLCGRRRAWDVRALDSAIDNLPADGGDMIDQTWSNIDAA
jgi:predicted DNA-binding transcriptional regulator AlpA